MSPLPPVPPVPPLPPVAPVAPLPVGRPSPPVPPAPSAELWPCPPLPPFGSAPLPPQPVSTTDAAANANRATQDAMALVQARLMPSRTPRKHALAAVVVPPWAIERVPSRRSREGPWRDHTMLIVATLLILAAAACGG